MGAEEGGRSEGFQPRLGAGFMPPREEEEETAEAEGEAGARRRGTSEDSELKTHTKQTQLAQLCSYLSH